MTAARVSERRLARQSSVLYPWRVPQGRCRYRECSSFEVASINQFTIFISIDPYIPTGFEPGLNALPIRYPSIIAPAVPAALRLASASLPCTLVF